MNNFKILSGFQGYSLGEDLYLSYLASKEGVLLINPSMRVKHYFSKIDRDKVEEFKRASIVNHFYLLGLYNSSISRYLALLWSVAGLIIKDVMGILRFNKERILSVMGYFLGIKDIAGLLRSNKMKYK